MQDALQQLARLAEIQKEATPGPWLDEPDSRPSIYVERVGEADPGGMWLDERVNGREETVQIGIIANLPKHKKAMMDAEFIAAAGSTDFAALLATLSAPAPLATGGAGEAEEQWIILCGKPGRGAPYWRPNGHGYTDSIVDAGRYSRAEAASVVEGSRTESAWAVSDPLLSNLLAKQSIVRANELVLWCKLAAVSPAPGVAIAAGGGWIYTGSDAETNLPKHDGLVFIRTDRGDYDQAMLSQGGGWQGYGDSCWDFAEVTHWMEIPKLPAASEKGASHE